MSSRVAFIYQNSYEEKSLGLSVARTVDETGFDLKAVSGKKVLLKPNMLGAYPPEMGITTHPAFVEAVAKIFITSGADVSIGDSPNGVHPLDTTWTVTGIKKVCQNTGAKEARFEASGSGEKNGIKISRAVLDADLVVNLPKFKTHGLTILTLAVKNLFGCVNGVQKTHLHRDLRDRKYFANAIVHIAQAVSPALTLIDGIVAMEGTGPSAGTLIHLNTIVAGTNIHLVDAACCELINFPPLELDTLHAAKKLGFWNENEKVEFTGDPIEKLRPAKFALPSTYTRGMRDWWITRIVLNRIWSGMSVEPKINPKRCAQCLLCVGACPVLAIEQQKKDCSPIVDLKKCIQCFCCHEICPHKAIDLKESFNIKLARLLADLNKRKKR